MKISTRLSLTFSTISSVIFILFGTGIYLFSSNYRKNDFQDKLKERVLVSEKMFLEKEIFSKEELKKITDQFLHTLPQETEEMVEIKPNESGVFKYTYPQKIREDALSNEAYYFEDAERQGMSRIFPINGKNYLIIVVAVDEVGLQNLSFLGRKIILLILIGIPLIFIGGFIITKRALLPLSKKIAHANNIGVTNLDQRLKVYNANDEIGKLAIAFNKLLDRLEESFDAQKSFISNASHEIKNPLTAIIGQAEVTLSRSRTEEEYLVSLKTILMEAEKLNTTTNNLLQLSKVTANERSVVFESIDFSHFLLEVKESFDFLNSQNAIQLELEKANEPLLALVNKELLKTAIFNLFDNACKFSSNADVKVTLDKKGKSVELTISDKGIGIAEKDLQKIFLPFHRGNNALKISGAGIGLSLSSKIIRLHQGTLDVQSQLDKGTQITMKIPLVSS
ncbi:MAG: signal transduction histidine kinase [Crocinitomix sp.]|jgi:signal transduction histidine kinase